MRKKDSETQLDELPIPFSQTLTLLTNPHSFFKLSPSLFSIGLWCITMRCLFDEIYMIARKNKHCV